MWDRDERSWLAAPRLDLTLQAKGIQIDRLIGSRFAGGALTFRAHVRGTTDDVALDVEFSEASALTVLGERVRLPARATLRVGRLHDRARGFSARRPGRRACSSAPARSGCRAGSRSMSASASSRSAGSRASSARRCPVAGSVSGAVRIVGEPRLPALSGELTLADVSYGGRALGGGTIKLTPEAKGAVRARGRLIDTIAVDGRLAPKPSGLEGDVTLTLAKVPIEPFLPPLPGKLVPRGIVSGTAVARIAPGKPATAEGRLSELALSLSSPPARGKSRGHDRRARRERDRAARARRRGPDAGSRPGCAAALGVDRARRARAAATSLRAALRGRRRAGRAGRVRATWLDRLAGSLDIDLTADRARRAG